MSSTAKSTIGATVGLISEYNLKSTGDRAFFVTSQIHLIVGNGPDRSESGCILENKGNYNEKFLLLV